MKKKSLSLSLNKFKISKVSNLSTIKGGFDGDGPKRSRLGGVCPPTQQECPQEFL